MISSHKAIFLTVLASACWATTSRADTGGYTGTDSAVYSFVDVSSSGASVLAGVDDGTAPLTIPYSFEFYGQAYTMVCVSSNGAMYLFPAPALVLESMISPTRTLPPRRLRAGFRACSHFGAT